MTRTIKREILLEQIARPPYLSVETELVTSGKWSLLCDEANSDCIGFARIVSPEIALRLLATSENNRKYTPSSLFEYKRLMQSDEWMVAAPLIFDEKGMLIDGHHRLKAVINSGHDVVFSIFVGIPSGSKAVIDQGKKRTAYDIAQIMGLTETKAVHTQTAGCLMLSHRKTVKISNKRRNEMYMEFKESIDFAISLVTSKSNLKAPRFLAAIAKASQYEERERLREFMSVADSLLVKKDMDIAAGSLAKAYLEARYRGDSRGSEVKWFLQAERSIFNFCHFDNDDSVAVSDCNFYPLPGIDEETDEILKRFKERKVE